MQFSYKGTNYNGYQVQNNKKTIQGCIEQVLSKILNENIKIYASGRTDAGVHAINQYAHFDTQTTMQLDNLQKSLNCLLPKDIKVKNLKVVDDNFNARFDVKKKTYIYVMNKNVQPLLCDLVSKLDYNIDIKLAKKSLKKLIGKHDFKGFCSSNNQTKNFIRVIYSAKLIQKNSYLIFKITGSGFLYNMVRIIVGTVIDIAREKLSLDIIDKMLKTGNRSLGGKTASEVGLFLYDVEY